MSNTKIRKDDALYAAIEWMNCYEGGEPGEGMYDALRAACLILAEQLVRDTASQHKRSYLAKLKKEGKKVHPDSRAQLDANINRLAVDTVNIMLGRVNNNLPIHLEYSEQTA